MPKLIFCSLLALLLVVSCECKDMHIRRMPDEKDIVFEGEANTAKKSVYRKGESRDIQVHLTSSDEEAKDAKFKILSATLADGSPADVDYDTLKIGDNTLSYTPKEPGTHALTIKVAVEGEEENAQTIHYTLEAPAANWKVRGTADATGNLTIQIADVPEELQGEPWRITSTTFSEGLEGRIEHMPTRLNHGENNLNISLDQIVLQEEASHVVFTIQGPDGSQRDDQVDLTTLCVAQLRGDMSELDRNLADRLLVVNDEHETETERLYQLPPETVTDPRVNREKQAEIEERLNLMERDLEAYDRDLQRLEALEVQDPTHPSRQLPMFRRGKQRLKDAIASLKSAQVQLQQQCTSAHEALFKTLENEEQEAIETLLEDPKLDVNQSDEKGIPLLCIAIEKRKIELIRKLIALEVEVNVRSGDTRFNRSALNNATVGSENSTEILNMLLSAGARVNENADTDGTTALHFASRWNNNEAVELLLRNGAWVNSKNDRGFTALHEAARGGHTEILNALLASRADVNAKSNDYGCSALHLAASSGHNEILNLLLERGADVNLKDFNGYTALRNAAFKGERNTVRLLLGREGVNVNEGDHLGRTPLHVAEEYGHNSVVILLRAAEAR